MPRNTYLKIALIALFATIIDLVMHVLWAPLYEYGFPASIFVQQDLFKPFAALLLFFIFIALGIVFISVQDKLPGRGLSKGFRFGIAFAILWVIAMPEMSLIFNSPMLHELLTGALDGLSLLILGILLGMFTATDNRQDSGKSYKSVISIPLIAMSFLAGRYLAYSVLGLDSVYLIKPLATFLWTLGIGLWIGAMYFLLRDGLGDRSPARRAFLFGAVVFGINWLLYNLFVVLILDVSLLEVAARWMVDAIFVILAILAFEKAFKNKN